MPTPPKWCVTVAGCLGWIGGLLILGAGHMWGLGPFIFFLGLVVAINWPEAR